METPWLTLKDACDYLKVSRATFYRLIQKGLIRGWELEGTDEKRYRKEDLDKLLKLPEEK